MSLKLNALQLKTLTILQALAESTGSINGDRPIPALPQAHDEHFHVGPFTVMRSDATGLQNGAVWAALNRKGLVNVQPSGQAFLTAAGANYDTGMAGQVLHSSDH